MKYNNEISVEKAMKLRKLCDRDATKEELERARKEAGEIEDNDN